MSETPSSEGAGLSSRRCRGFRVQSPDGHVGFVEEVLYGSDPEEPAALAVRSGIFCQRVEIVALEAIVEIVASERRIVVRGLPASVASSGSSC